ncbi:hypothetical protein FKV42_13125 [Methanolobus vulcani]|uniref:Uncharacterized protein n=2 Tax=Methanolobus vulcani TaxID=38026 RepID=A0A7Z8KMS5_9EURY|nr:hypothetical protein FKV42_13125 [Methanolobus vulcani]
MKKSSYSYSSYIIPIGKYNSVKPVGLVCLSLALCIILLQIPAMALSSDNGNLSVESVTAEQGNVSEYSHLIEVSLLDTGHVVVSESIVYLIDSAEDEYSNQSQIMLWISENAEIMQFQASDMAGANSALPVNYTRDGNYLYFYSLENESSSGMPLLYGISYVLPDTGNEVLRKVIYKEEELEQPISRLIVTVYHNGDAGISISSENEDLLTADNTVMEENYSSYMWNAPKFNEFTITCEEKELVQDTTTSGNSRIIPILIVIIIVVAGGYHYMKKRTPANSNDINELEDLYEAEMIVIDRIKKDRKNNKLSQEEFDKLKKKHSESASKIKSEMEKLKKD